MTHEDVIEQLSFFDDWEQRYAFIIDLGKSLPTFDESQRTPENLVRGCQSQVWLAADKKQDRYHFLADSDASIVRGLLAIIMAAYQDKTAKEVLDFDIQAYFSELDLLNHLSPTRGNGINAMVERIRKIAND